MLINSGLIFLELKRRYSVLLRLADNFLVTNQETIFDAKFNNIDTVYDARSEENEIYIRILSA